MADVFGNIRRHRRERKIAVYARVRESRQRSTVKVCGLRGGGKTMGRGAVMAKHEDLLPLAEKIASLMLRDHAESRRIKGAAWERSAEGREVQARLKALREQARARFAAARGWIWTRCEFHTDGLVHGLRRSPLYTGQFRGERDSRDIRVALGRPWIDHAEFYRTPGRGGVCAGIVTHAYL